MYRPAQKDGEPPELLIDPAIWYPPSRCSKTGLVRSLLSNSPPLADNRRSLPSYVRDGLAAKRTRRQPQNADSINKSTILSFQPLSPLSSVISIGTPTSLPSTEWHSAARDAMSNSSTSSSAGSDNQLLSSGYVSLLSGNPAGLLHYEGPFSLGTKQGQTETTMVYNSASNSSRHLTSGHTGRLNSFTGSSSTVLPGFSSPQQTTTSFASSQPRVQHIMQTSSWRARVSSSAAATTEQTSPEASSAYRPTWSSTSSLPSPFQLPAKPLQLQHRSKRQQRTSPTKRTSPNYRGDPSNPKNQSADVPADQNTSVFIEGLPADCAVRDLVGGGGDSSHSGFLDSSPGNNKSAPALALLRDTGKIYALSVGGPKPQAGIHTSCAKLVYWDRSGVERLFEKLARRDGDGEGGDAGGLGNRLVVKMNW